MLLLFTVESFSNPVLLTGGVHKKLGGGKAAGAVEPKHVDVHTC